MLRASDTSVKNASPTLVSLRLFCHCRLRFRENSMGVPGVTALGLLEDFFLV
jgi:ribosomal protein S14